MDREAEGAGASSQSLSLHCRAAAPHPSGLRAAVAEEVNKCAVCIPRREPPASPAAPSGVWQAESSDRSCRALPAVVGSFCPWPV